MERSRGFVSVTIDGARRKTLDGFFHHYAFEIGAIDNMCCATLASELSARTSARRFDGAAVSPRTVQARARTAVRSYWRVSSRGR